MIKKDAGDYKASFSLARATGLGFASRRTVVLLGLATASRARKLAGTCSGVQIPTELKQFSSFARYALHRLIKGRCKDIGAGNGI
jgi:hypothetical protein